LWVIEGERHRIDLGTNGIGDIHWW
jgi:hypothetical protein